MHEWLYNGVPRGLAKLAMQPRPPRMDCDQSEGKLLNLAIVLAN